MHLIRMVSNKIISPSLLRDSDLIPLLVHFFEPPYKYACAKELLDSTELEQCLALLDNTLDTYADRPRPVALDFDIASGWLVSNYPSAIGKEDDMLRVLYAISAHIQELCLLLVRDNGRNQETFVQAESLPKLYQHFLPDEAMRHGALRVIATIAIGSRSNDTESTVIGDFSPIGGGVVWNQYGHQYVVRRSLSDWMWIDWLVDWFALQSHKRLDRGTEEDRGDRFYQQAPHVHENGYPVDVLLHLP